jgi:hypothetical protein
MTPFQASDSKSNKRNYNTLQMFCQLLHAYQPHLSGLFHN